MTRAIALVKNNKLTELIKEVYSIVFNRQPQEKPSIQKENLPDSKKIVRPNKLITDEYGYFNRMENL